MRERERGRHCSDLGSFLPVLLSTKNWGVVFRAEGSQLACWQQIFLQQGQRAAVRKKYNINQKSKGIPSSNFWKRNFNDFKNKNETAGACEKMFSIYDYHPKEHQRSS